MSSDKCTMQYYYPNEELRKKYNIKCNDKYFVDIENYEMFNNEDFLKFVNEKYGEDAFIEDSPFAFNKEYINLTNEDICKTTEYSLKPQQKFMGQFINPVTNFNNTLVFHGLGSGKTCTSLVIGEAFKTVSKKNLLYSVPAALVDSFLDEILGELRNNTEEDIKMGKQPELWACTSQCVINGKQDFYTNVNDNRIIQFLESQINKLNIDMNTVINKINSDGATQELNSKFIKLEQEIKKTKIEIDRKKSVILSKVSKVFTIESHIKFINNLFKTTKDGTWTKGEYLTNKNSPLLSSNGVLIIDEIQRLVSESGVLYNKLYSAIYQYINPKCRIIVLSATPIYDNPYELALTMNLLRPRMPFPLSKEIFNSFFIGDVEGKRVFQNNFIKEDSSVINRNLLRIMCAGYISYFRGGNPMAYPYKRIITLEHKMATYQKDKYVDALKSDIKKQESLFSKLLGQDKFIINRGYDENLSGNEDSVSGIYVTSQQYCNIALPFIKSDIIDNLLIEQKRSQIKIGLDSFKTELQKIENKNVENVLNYIREKGYSEKFVNIIDLSVKCDGPVFIFSNWLQFGVQSLSLILDACGFKRFPEPGENRYFVWSSETSNDKDLISKAKKTFNSMENKDGSLIKIILGTRSIMEGVSFKNVKQVHITDPWWNEARIEQILARAVRFCSHSGLPLDKQYIDIFRHYSVLPITPDPYLKDFLKEEIKKNQVKFKTEKNTPTSFIDPVTKNPITPSGNSVRSASYNMFLYLTVEQKMSQSANKKYDINIEIENTIKQVAYDCDLNKNGNIIRLEENIRPIQEGGKYQIYFKNPTSGVLYIREGIPTTVSYQDMMNRSYSYPNDVELPVKFYEVFLNEKSNLLEKIEDPGYIVLKEPEINKNLTLYEEIQCWNKNLTVENIFDKLNQKEENRDIISYLMRIKQNFDLLPRLRIKIHGEEKVENRIEFKNAQKIMIGKDILIKCLKRISQSDITSKAQKNMLTKLLTSQESAAKSNSQIMDIIYKYKYMTEDDIENLRELDPKTLAELFKEAKKNYEN